ncbi:MAG: TolB-like 6-bladed beta-propeller domain-containing protein [Tannerella sp.]|nr:TolB-like 6-bladed beta-propeller domain-containing protein [Tannerella sp.]
MIEGLQVNHLTLRKRDGAVSKVESRRHDGAQRPVIAGQRAVYRHCDEGSNPVKERPVDCFVPRNEGVESANDESGLLRQPRFIPCGKKSMQLFMNRKLIHITFFAVMLSLFVCCNKNKDSYYFNGNIRYIDNSSKTVKNVTSKSIRLDGVQSGMIAVYDSLLICWHPDFSNHFFYISNLDSGNEIGFFCEKGQGPKEATSVNCISQMFRKEDDICTFLWAYNESQLFLWNISQSVEQRMTVYDTIVSYDKNRYFFLFYQPEDILFVNRPSDMLNSEEATTPFYEKRSIYTKEVIRDYPVYKKKSVKSRDASMLEPFFYTWDVIKPDGTKIAQAMRSLPQINMLDIHTGEVIGFRMQKGSDFSLLESYTDIKSKHIYYNCVQADDHFIYATYWGKEQWVDRIGVEMPLLNTIHVFDWNGKLLYELITDRPFFRSIWLDQIRNRLYTIDVNTDEVYYLDLDELNL